MRMWLVFAMLISTPLFAQSPPGSQPVQEQKAPPLTDEEKRLILQQLYELKAAREQIRLYEQYIRDEQAQDEREKALSARELEVERQATKNAEERARLANEQADLYRQFWEAATKKRGGVGCTLKRIITLGIARCGG